VHPHAKSLSLIPLRPETAAVPVLGPTWRPPTGAAYGGPDSRYPPTWRAGVHGRARKKSRLRRGLRRRRRRRRAARDEAAPLVYLRGWPATKLAYGTKAWGSCGRIHLLWMDEVWRSLRESSALVRCVPGIEQSVLSRNNFQTARGRRIKVYGASFRQRLAHIQI
jgi:hypothetical protein